jgi:hypothetical protein
VFKELSKRCFNEPLINENLSLRFVRKAVDGDDRKSSTGGDQTVFDRGSARLIFPKLPRERFM